MNKEQIYDAKLYPLMTQIIEVCKAHKIAMVASFAIPNDEDEGLCCTTALTTKAFDPPDTFRRCVVILSEQPAMLAETISTRPDGSQHISIRRVT